MERRKFTREFKLEAVRLIKDRGVSYVQASQDLGVHTSQLRSWVGVPRGRVELDSGARNTMENAINAKRLVAPAPGERWLLVTSASHMPRAVGLFREVGFPVEAYPVDWQTAGWADLTSQSFSLLGGFVHLDMAAHEWVALAFDRVSGRTSTLFPSP